MIKTYLDEVQSLLSNALSVPVYESEVPETVGLPAVAFFNLGYSNGRVVNGRKISDTMNFRVMVVGERTADIDNTCIEIGELDNTKNDDFQMIQVTGNNLEPKQTGVNVRRMMIDLKLTV